MDTDRTGKPDLTRVPIPSGSTEEGPGGADRNVETPKGPNQGLGVRGRGLQRRMHAELGEMLVAETYLSRLPTLKDTHGGIVRERGGYFRRDRYPVQHLKRVWVQPSPMPSHLAKVVALDGSMA